PGVARLHDTGVYEDIRFTAFDFREGELWSAVEKKHKAPMESAQAVRLARTWLSAQLHARSRGAVFGTFSETPILFLSDGSLQILAAGRSGDHDETCVLRDASRFLYQLLAGREVTSGADEIPTELDADLRHILMKALQEESGKGYHDLREFQADLGRWERDEPVQARSQTWWYRTGKKIKRHRKKIVWSGLAGSVCLAVVLFFWGEKLKEVASWRLAENVQPDPRDGRWSASYFPNWLEKNGTPLPPGNDRSHWKFEKDLIRGGGFPGLDNLTFQSSVPGNIRVEWIRRGLEANEGFNCFLGGSNRFQAYTFHVGAWGDLRACVLTKGPGLDRLATILMDKPLRPDQTYRFRMDAEGNRLRLFIDGRKWIDAEDPDAEHSPGPRLFGFEANSGCIHEISRLKIYSQAPPEKNRAIAVAEAWLGAGYLDLARRGYAEILQVFPRTSMAPQAFYRLGRIESALSNQEAASA
ncbi:MAG: hypothetical protein JNM63_11460, partial [Spirochaetia bacterium]|nr:hypothetical protein [Spirochaetia bacterium]